MVGPVFSVEHFLHHKVFNGGYSKSLKSTTYVYMYIINISYIINYRSAYTLWWTNILPWKITMFNGKTTYFYGHFQIAMLVHQRVCGISYDKYVYYKYISYILKYRSA